MFGFLGFGGAFLISFAQLENGGLIPINVVEIGAGVGFVTVIVLIRFYVKGLKLYAFFLFRK